MTNKPLPSFTEVQLDIHEGLYPDPEGRQAYLDGREARMANDDFNDSLFDCRYAKVSNPRPDQERLFQAWQHGWHDEAQWAKDSLGR